MNKPNNQQRNGNGKDKRSDHPLIANATTRRGEVQRASRRQNEVVNLRASQHKIDVPVNKSVYNGYDGRQFTASDQRRANVLPIKQEKTLKVIPLGGLGEMGIGKNMMALEYDNDIITIDMGLLFPGPDYPGINYLVPDISYLEERKNKIRGHVFTHAHLDHIGAAKHLIHKIPAPVYASKFTTGMIERQMEESTSGYKPIYNVLSPEAHERVQLGDSFSIELLRVNHSVPDSTAVVIRTPVGTVIHTGDWRFEDKPVDGKLFDTARLKEIAQEGVLLLLNESTNCEFFKSSAHGEDDIKESFSGIMKKAKGRVIISAFSSQIHRIQSVLWAAKENNRRVAFAGYSMIQNLEVALRSGAIKVPKDTIMRMEDLIRQPDEKIVVVSTGSQGEINAVLARMATGAHKHIKVKPTDTIVFSSDPIPGNESNVVRTVDGLMREGSYVLENKTRQLDGCGPLHLSGHAYHDDHITLINMVKPKFYVPIHGEFHMLVRNAELAVKDAGMKAENVFVMDSGDVLELTKDKAAKTGRIPVGAVMFDQAGSEVSDVVLKDRLHMSSEGMFVVVLTVSKQTGRLLTSPDIISRGFIYLRGSEELMASIRQYLKHKMMRAYSRGRVDLDDLKKEIKDDVAHILYEETKRTPIVIPVINEIATAPTEAPVRAKPIAGNT